MDVHRLSNREHFVDDRGVGLRVTRHPEGTVVVLSIWHGEGCAGTFRLPVAEAPRIGNIMAPGTYPIQKPSKRSMPGLIALVARRGRAHVDVIGAGAFGDS